MLRLQEGEWSGHVVVGTTILRLEKGESSGYVHQKKNHYIDAEIQPNRKWASIQLTVPNVNCTPIILASTIQP